MTDAGTGLMMDLNRHIAQSVKNILFTRINTRIMREAYGSMLPELIDMPMTPNVVMLCRQAIVSALAKWEPRIKISRVNFDTTSSAQGRLKIILETSIISSGASETFIIEDL